MYNTSNLKLNQFERTDYFNIDFYNQNNQILDKEVAELKNSKENTNETIMELGKQVSLLQEDVDVIKNEIVEIKESIGGITTLESNVNTILENQSIIMSMLSTIVANNRPAPVDCPVCSGEQSVDASELT